MLNTECRMLRAGVNSQYLKIDIRIADPAPRIGDSV
jgi:hypothetical protein